MTFFVKSKIGPKICVFLGGNMGSKCHILFSGPPKISETTSFDVLIVKIGAGVLAVG